MKASASFPLLHSTKTVIFDNGKGLDQLGNEIGKPEPGDVVKCHMKASYIAPMRRPWLGLFGKEAPRKKEFLDTGMVGETCFYEVTIPPPVTTMKHPSTARDIITGWIQTMTLGEVAKFELDLDELENDYPKVKWMFATSSSSSSSSVLLHRSQYAQVPENVQKVKFRISSFRIVRNQKEHHRKDINGRGGMMIGSFAMAC